jgi:hypothetical protein
MIVSSEQKIRERMRLIKENRENFSKNNKGTVLDSKSFMSVVNKYADSCGKYMFNDYPPCAYCGVIDINENKNYYCPIEDLTEKEIEKIDSLKPQPPH